MPGILERIEVRGGAMNLSASSVPVDEVLGRLGRGEDAVKVRDAMGLDSSGIVAALAVAGLGPGPDDGPGLGRARPSRPELVEAASERSMRSLFPGAESPDRGALSAGLLQILDAWEASHTAAQAADDAGERLTSMYWHGIAHRREPDPSNARYWFRRVGRHRDFEGLAVAARPLLDAHGDPGLADRLLRGGWDPFAFIDLCTGARPGSAEAAVACRIQRLEMSILLESSLGQVS